MFDRIRTALNIVRQIIASKGIAELYEDTLDEFENGKKKQHWEVVPRIKVIKLWRDFSRTGVVTLEEIFEIYEQTIDNLKQIIVNSVILDSDHINDKNIDRWNEFVSDEKGHGHYTDQDVRFGEALQKLETARTPMEKLLMVDNVFNLVHGMGPVADWFIEGGTRTLSELEEWQAPKKKALMKTASIIVARLEKEIEKAKKAKLPSVFLGGSCEDNEWRQKLKKEFKDKLYFIDPYDPDWTPEDNIYDELAAIINADYTIFYKGGEGSEKEQWFLDQSDREYADFDDLDKLRAYLERLAEPVVKKACISNSIRKLAESIVADYPKHPDDLVLPKSDWSSKALYEKDIYKYYSGAISKMLPELKGRNLFIGIVPKGYKSGKPIYIRHPYHGNTEYIRIDNAIEFEIYHSGRLTEIHVTMPRQCPYFIVDIDAPGKFSDTKKITAEVADALEKVPEVKNVEIRYSGKRGFHVLGWLKKSKDVDDARSFLHEWLKETFGDRDDVVLGESPQGDKPALGLSPMKVNGGQVALWSLRVSGLCCVEVPRSQLMSFEREDASLEKTFKKLTGKTFSSKQASTYPRFHIIQRDRPYDMNEWTEEGQKRKQKQIEEDASIPRAKIEELPMFHVEKPVAKAVKALIHEGTVSSGFHFNFSKEFTGIDPCWAIVFKGRTSRKIERAAKKAGLEINYRGIPSGDSKIHIKSVTDVYLPGVGKTEIEKATKIFDRFADEYSRLSKKVASILNQFINGETRIVRNLKALNKICWKTWYV